MDRAHGARRTELGRQARAGASLGRIKSGASVHLTPRSCSEAANYWPAAAHIRLLGWRAPVSRDLAAPDARSLESWMFFSHSHSPVSFRRADGWRQLKDEGGDNFLLGECRPGIERASQRAALIEKGRRNFWPPSEARKSYLAPLIDCCLLATFGGFAVLVSLAASSRIQSHTWLVAAASRRCRQSPKGCGWPCVD